MHDGNFVLVSEKKYESEKIDLNTIKQNLEWISKVLHTLMYDGNFIPATDLKWSMSKYLYLLLTPPLFCACLETGNGFPASYVLIFIYVQGVKKSLKIPNG